MRTAHKPGNVQRTELHIGGENKKTVSSDHHQRISQPPLKPWMECERLVGMSSAPLRHDPFGTAKELHCNLSAASSSGAVLWAAMGVQPAEQAEDFPVQNVPSSPAVPPPPPFARLAHAPPPQMGPRHTLRKGGGECFGALCL